VGGARELLELTASLAADFLDSLDERPVFPAASLEELRSALGSPLPDDPVEPARVVRELADAADAGVVAMAGGRYFGFVIGGSVPAALAADWLATTWDQNAGLYVGGPAVSVAEEVAGGWLRELLRLPETASFGFVTGCQMAHVTALAAARHRVLANAGWDVNLDGLAGAPPISVLVGEKVHVTVPRALRLLGIGASSVVPVAADDQGRMRPDALRDALARVSGPAIVCAQAGEVNTGAFDALPEIAAAGREAGAWLHLDGAFGLWAAASPRLAHLVEGAELFDSWATDAHKWLNVPYDNGVAFCADPEAHRAAMAVHADYLVHAEPGAARDQMEWNPEFSRRARGVPVYAALRSLGRSGIAELVERCCSHARRFSAELDRFDGVEVLNDVVLNQVLFRYETDERTDEVLRAVQESGEAWMSGTVWDGRKAIRISVSNWQTSDADVDRTLGAFAAAYPTALPAR
jgi:glutamate/tyrosine decarboxylase-like PLP-dependent enzyme